MDTLLQDIRYAFRKLVRTPGFTVVALLTLALAIGATTAVYSVVDRVLLRPLPFDDPDALVRVSESEHGRTMPLSGPDYVDYRDQSRSFTGMAPIGSYNANLTSTGVEPLRLSAARVGARFFSLLGVSAEKGRTFATGEDAVGAPRTVVLSDQLWRSHFGADPRILGQTITLDGNPYTVIGVAPPSLRFPQRPDIWVPFQWQPWEIDPQNRGAHSFFAIARLKPGVTRDAALAELRGIAARLRSEYPRSNAKSDADLAGLQDVLVGQMRAPLLALLGAVAFVLLIACANIANLLLVRAAAREPEIAVRTALGAGRGRIVRQLVTESVILAVVGTVLGIAVATWAVGAVVAFGPTDIPRLEEVAVDGPVLLFSAAIAVVTGILFGLVPALHAARPNLAGMLRDSARGTSRGGIHRTRSALVVTEMALAVVLLIGAGLLIRSFARLTRVDPGFRTDQVVTFSLSLPSSKGSKYYYEPQVSALTDRLTQQLRELPGTQTVGVTFGRPMSGHAMRTSFDVVGQAPNPPGHETLTDVYPASPGFFGALRIPIVAGRLYDSTEDRSGARAVVVVNQEFARRYFAGRNPVGKSITLGIGHDTGSAGATASTDVHGEIVGVVGNVKQRALADSVVPTTYVPWHAFPLGDLSVVVRSTSAAGTLEHAIRGVVASVDPDLPVYDLETMSQVVSSTVAQPRFYTLLLTSFATIALLLAALGIYGVISYTVAQRERELGIRIALGAPRERVVRLVLGQGTWLAVAGVAIGIVAAVALTRTLSRLLFEVPPLDPVTFAAVAVVLLGVAALASYLPARRAARVDPLLAMRAE